MGKGVSGERHYPFRIRLFQRQALSIVPSGKSKTTSAELAEYIEQLDDQGPYDRMFYVYHSGAAETDDARVTIINPEKLSELVLDAGLANWLIRKVS